MLVEVVFAKTIIFKRETKMGYKGCSLMTLTLSTKMENLIWWHMHFQGKKK